MPILMALWQSISRVPALSQGHFLWLNLGNADPTFILPVLAAIFTFASTYLSSMSQVESNASLKVMNFVMPVMILVMGGQFSQWTFIILGSIKCFPSVPNTIDQ